MTVIRNSESVIARQRHDRIAEMDFLPSFIGKQFKGELELYLADPMYGSPHVEIFRRYIGFWAKLKNTFMMGDLVICIWEDWMEVKDMDYIELAKIIATEFGITDIVNDDIRKVNCYEDCTSEKP